MNQSDNLTPPPPTNDLRSTAEQLAADGYPALALDYRRRADATERKRKLLQEHGEEIWDLLRGMLPDAAKIPHALAAHFGWTPHPTLLEALDQIDRESATLEDDDASLRGVRG